MKPHRPSHQPLMPAAGTDALGHAPTIENRLRAIQHAVVVTQAVTQGDSEVTTDLLEAIGALMDDAFAALNWLALLPSFVLLLPAPDSDALDAVNRDDNEEAAERVTRTHLAPVFGGPTSDTLTHRERELLAIYREMPDTGRGHLAATARIIRPLHGAGRTPTAGRRRKGGAR